MTLTTVKEVGTESGIIWMHLSGTITEVLQGLCSERVTARNVAYYSDDGSTAKAVACGRE